MYSGLQYNAIVYEGFLPAAPAATGGDGPGSNVLNLDDSGGRLGCGVPDFFITSRCASSGVNCVLTPNVTNAHWDRRLDDVSEAEVTCTFSGDSTYTCCECLGETEPWCHELHVWRDGEEVWVGPIQSIEYEHDQVIVKAKDSLGWLGVRIPPVDIDFADGLTDLTDVALFLLDVAFAEDGPTYTCEVDNVFSAPTGLTYEIFFEGFNQTALEILRDLGDAGLDFTTLGRTIVLVGDSTSLTPLVLLNDEHIMGGLKVVKDGTLMGNRYYVHFEGDGGVPASGEAANFYCYTAIERIRDGDGLNSGIDAASVADNYVRASAIAPRTVEMAPNSKLSPDTPWTINQMVPGARVDVAVTKLCLNLTQSFRLTQVDVEYNPEDGESVGITLVPLNDIEVA